MLTKKTKILNEPKGQKEKIDINEVVAKALETLDLDLQSFKKIAGEAFIENITHNGRPSLDHVFSIDLFNILRRLHLNNTVVLSGHEKEEHLGAICASIRKSFNIKKAIWSSPLGKNLN